MDTIIDFIRNFHPVSLRPNLGLVLTIIGLLFVGLILINWGVSFLPPRIGKLIKTAIRWTLRILYYGIVVLSVLNAIVTGDYSYVLLLLILYVASKVDPWYKVYDDFVDRKINRELEKKKDSTR